jgi:hypothetical protein
MATIRFYKYFFIGLEKPVIMEAENKMMADDMLYHLSEKSKTNIDMSLLEDVRVETPLFGISKRKRHGKDFVWVGVDNTSDGWLEQKEYDAIQKLKNNK